MNNADTMEAHQTLVVNAVEAIQKVHADTTVSLEVTLDSLRELAGEAQDLARAVERDVENAEAETEEDEE